ncbi:MAG: type II secretion system protein [Desulfobacterales bacterium]|nr:type II secretion system protein [Desulfobacterales bacterium]MDX2512254.1 type II secretion system protein [Desulfobacterales bacterium]
MTTTRLNTIFKVKGQGGFTLIEMLIVVIVLGILAMIIIPQISVSTQDAKLNTLTTNLGSLRNAVELYYHQHDSRYPGSTKATDGTATVSHAEAIAAIVPQLTQYTDVDGQTSTTKVDPFIYGPYLKGTSMPTNPFNNKSDVTAVFDENDITVRSSAGDDFGWKFYPVTGVLIAADNGAHDTL